MSKEFGSGYLTANSYIYDLPKEKLVEMVMFSERDVNRLIVENHEKQEKLDKVKKYIKDRMILEQSFSLDKEQCIELLEMLGEE